MTWFDDKDDVKTILNHLGDKVPQSIADAAKRELEKRGFSSEQVRQLEIEREK
jgi:hypothetical protein